MHILHFNRSFRKEVTDRCNFTVWLDVVHMRSSMLFIEYSVITSVSTYILVWEDNGRLYDQYCIHMINPYYSFIVNQWLLVMGMTDIDDKIIARAKERGCGVRELARKYEYEFLRDMARLNVCCRKKRTTYLNVYTCQGSDQDCIRSSEQEVD